MSILAQRHRHQPPVSSRYLAHDLRELGIEPTQSNMKIGARVAAAAYREASVAACEELGQPIAQGEVWPLPHHLQKLTEQSVRGQQAALPTSPPGHLGERPDPGPPEVRQDADRHQPQQHALPRAPRISEFAKAAPIKKIDDGAWDPGRRRDVEDAVAIFIAAHGDLAFNTITQDHLIAMKDLFHRLPREYGRESKDKNGKKVRATIHQALARGDALLA